MDQSSRLIEHLLMVQPDAFAIKYIINPWMQNRIGTVNTPLAREQWQCLHAILSEYATIAVLDAKIDMPDLVFSANAGLVNNNVAVISNFLHCQRQIEEPVFEHWFQQQGFKTVRLDKNIIFEGAGDALLQPGVARLWLGYGYRSSFAAVQALVDLLAMEVLPLKLVDPDFYHLDTCFCPLIGGLILYYPEAFDDVAQQLIEEHYDEQQRIVVSPEDAKIFACNCINLASDVVSQPGGVIVMNVCSDALQQQLRECGYFVITTPTSEFIKAGGSVKCLVLQLSQSV